MSHQERHQQFTIDSDNLFIHHRPTNWIGSWWKFGSVNPQQPEGTLLTAQTHSADIILAAGYQKVPVRDRLRVARFIRRNANRESDDQINSVDNIGKRNAKRAKLIAEGHFGGGEVYALPGTQLAVKVVDRHHYFPDAFGSPGVAPNAAEFVHMANLYEMVKRYGSGKVVIPKHYALITPRGGAFKNVYMVMELMSPDTWIPSSKIPENKQKEADALRSEALQELYSILGHQPTKKEALLWANDARHDNILFNLKEGKVCFVDQYL